ncbi:DNA methyltransferase [Nesterenkonia sphaerica]|uniref:DNA methyltransferase n=1 Tax=Nesterenkonia sphaerica TaxID=1804988 RepID=UPI001FB7394B|nr:DNA methyltransferase [Nesterenkonia sphaerica]
MRIPWTRSTSTPPYNTGARDWKYNNDYVEGDDLYRHSKWLAFMERRLKLARELLNPDDSVLIVTIDEKEYLRLGLLLEQTFPEAETQMITSVIKPGGTSRTDRFSRVEEFVFVTFFGSARVQRNTDNMLFDAAQDSSRNIAESDFWEGMVRRGIGVIRAQRPKQFYPIIIDPSVPKIVGPGEALALSQSRDSYVSPEGMEVAWPIKDDGTEGFWQLSPQGLNAATKRGTVRVAGRNQKTGQWRVQYMKAGKAKRVVEGEVATLGKDAQGAWVLDPTQMRVTTLPTPRSVWHRKSHDASANGAGLLNGLLPKRKFPFPKALYAVEDVLRFFVKEKPNAVVLDFFSGSGTTAHAVMRLNKQDGGIRQCISVTNNEVSAEEQIRLRMETLRPGDPEWEKLGICEYVTKPRIRAAITGITPHGEPIKGDYKFVDEFPMSEGFDENAAFFTLTYESPWRVSTGRAFAAIAPMLWLRAGAVGRRIDTIHDGWEVADSYGVINDLDKASGFIAALKEAEKIRVAYIVTDDEGRYQQIANELPGIDTVRLYEDYLRNCESTV